MEKMKKKKKKGGNRLVGSAICFSMERLLLPHSCGRNVLLDPMVSHSEDNRKLHHVAERVAEGVGIVAEEARIAALAGTVELVEVVVLAWWHSGVAL